MTRTLRTVVLSIAVAATALTAAAPAFADDYYYRDRHHGYRGGDAVALGALGLATGLIVGSAVSQPRYAPDIPVYRDPPPPRYYREAVPVYRAPYADNDGYYPAPPVRARRVSNAVGVEPWSPEWARYCANRYQSFDRRSGTYVGYDGRSHFCTAG
jgi:hypothetical protein